MQFDRHINNIDFYKKNLQVRCLTLFVTHYPMLAEFQRLYPDVVGNFHMSFLLYDGEWSGPKV